MTLLEKAKAYGQAYAPPAAEPFDERLELALAWLRFEVSTTQVDQARERAGGGNWVAQTLRDAIQEGKIALTELRQPLASRGDTVARDE